MRVTVWLLLFQVVLGSREESKIYHKHSLIDKKQYVPVSYGISRAPAILASQPLYDQFPFTESYDILSNDQKQVPSSAYPNYYARAQQGHRGGRKDQHPKLSYQGRNGLRYGYGHGKLPVNRANFQHGYGTGKLPVSPRRNVYGNGKLPVRPGNYRHGYGTGKLPVSPRRNVYGNGKLPVRQGNYQHGYGTGKLPVNYVKSNQLYDEYNKHIQTEDQRSYQPVNGTLKFQSNPGAYLPKSSGNGGASISNPRNSNNYSTVTMPGISDAVQRVNMHGVKHEGQKEMIANNAMFSDTLVQENIITLKGVTTTKVNGDCTGLGLVYNGEGHVEIESTKFTKLPTEDLTFLAWIRPRYVNRIGAIYSSAIAGGGRQILEVRSADGNNANGRLKWTVKTDKTNTIFSAQTEQIIPAGIWTHVIAKYDGTQGRAYLFVNGEKVVKLKDVKTKAVLPWGKNIVLGGFTDEAEGVKFRFLGEMLDMRFVEKPLSDPEIDAAYKKCKPQDAGKPYLVTVCSGEKLGSGTTSGVYIQITGENGQFGEIKLGSSFSAGCTKVITIYGPPVGKIEKISVRKSNKMALSKTWVLDKISISTETSPIINQVYHFYCSGCKFKEDNLHQVLNASPQVNGAWSDWSEWSGCGSGMCGGDRKVRTRSCTNPVPAEGGKACMFPDKTFGISENQTEECQVDGDWGAWSSWTECDKICGGSKVTRTRVCDNPEPKNKGKDCVGGKQETKMDCTQECEDWPVNGMWSEWGEWSACAKSCGGSPVTRTRTCTNPAPLRKGLPCEGDDKETVTECTQHCPIDGVWTDWGPWTDCSATCGPGKQTRQRNCTNPAAAFGGKECPEKDNEVKECKLVACPNAVNGNWGEWGAWSECSEKEFCNLGVKKRTRNCDKPAPAEGGDPCVGLDTEDEICPTEKCKPADGDSIKVKPSSFITESCKADTGFFAGGTKATDLPGSLYDKHLKAIADEIKTSYFSKTEEKNKGETITKFCFQPSRALPIAKVEKVFPGYPEVPSLPEFKKPPSKENTAGLSVSLKADGSLYAAEFSLGESATYSPIKGVKLKKARFFFKTKSGERGIMAYGQHEFVNNVFDVEVKQGPEVKGTSEGQVDLETIINTLSLPQATSLVGSPAVTAQDTLKNLFIDYLVNLGLSKVQVSGLSEAASATTKRISGAVISGDTKEMFYVEIVKQKDFAIGLSSDKATFNNFMNMVLKKLKKKPGSFELFGSMTDTTVGIAYAQKGFVVDSATKFEKEPLKSAAGVSMKEGVFIAIRTKLPQECKSKVCELAHAILGKDSVLMFTGNANMKGLEFTAAVLDRKITETIKFSKIELYVKAKFLPPSATVGFRMAVKFPIEGEVYKDNILQPKSELTFVGTLEISTPIVFGATLEMKGLWRKVFGISFLAIGDIKLSFIISAAGIPTQLGFSGTVQLGKDCYFPQDFEKNGMCIQGSVGFSLGTELSTQYVYGDISAVTIGKVFRMLGSKLELPEKIANSGFEKEVVISFAGKEQSINFQGAEKKLKSGLNIKGAVNLLGFSIVTEIQVSTQIVFFQVELPSFELPGKIILTRSLTDKKNGPLFYAKATRDPLSVEIFLQGATTIFGVGTEIKFLFKPSLIEATLKLKLPVGELGAEVYVKGTYGTSLKETGFLARVTITSGLLKVQKDASADVEKTVNDARGKIQGARDKIMQKKEDCERTVTGYCEKCQENVCNAITANCESALDQFKNYIGEAANKFGGWFVGASKQIASTFKKERERRSIEFFPGRAQMMTRLRRKRFIGNYLCKTLAPAICAGSRQFCQASCTLKKHITKGVCKGLDLAHKSLFLVEEGFHWAKRLHDVVLKDLLIVHSIAFELELSSTLGARVAATIDITILKVRRKIGLDISLAKLIEMGKEIVNKAISEFKSMLTKRYTEPKYDKPINVGDVIVGGPFRIQNVGNKLCIKSPGPDKVEAGLSTSACSSADSQWVYTLTGALMNIHSGLCLGFTGAGKDLKIVQQPCKLTDKNQHFTCQDNRIFLGDTKTECLMEKASVVIASPCTPAPKDETVEFKIPGTEEWVVDGDPRLKVCDNFVQDIAINKPTTQSSTFDVKNFDAEELKLLDPKDKGTLTTKTGPQLAVNGDMSSTLKSGSCSLTSQTKDPWWKVDLQAEHVITDVSIQTVSEGPKYDALENFEIRVGILPDFKKNPMCGVRVTASHVGELWTSTCDPPIPGQYVSVQTFGERHLALCEVAVYARKDNRGKCSTELKRRRANIAKVSHRDRVLKRARITYGRYD